ncbi:MAG TPA: ParB/RepB/Spo0J family partition protein [Clostridia bacterium]|nr:ParB/RepB/Spo0J family partition protein [Clostridia bacterium]
MGYRLFGGRNRAAGGEGGSQGRIPGFSSSEVARIPIDSILHNPYQPRESIQESSLEELASSIKTHGVLQPIIVRKAGKGFEVVAGERRLRAARLAGLTEVPAIIRECTDRDQALLALVENLQREDLNPIEVARGYKVLLEEFGLTQEELAAELGTSQSSISNKLRLLKLPEEIVEAISREIITERHAREVLKVDGEEAQMRAFREICNSGLTVQETECLVSGMLSRGEAAASGDFGKGRGRVEGRKMRVGIYRDLRIFLNSFRQVVKELRKAGVGASLEEDEDEQYIRVTVRIKKPGIAK